MRVYRQAVDAFIKQTYDQDWSDEEIAAPFHSVHSGTVIPPVTAVLPQVPETEALLGAKASECDAIMRSSGCSGRAQSELRTCSGMLRMLRNAYPRLRSRRQLLRPNTKTEPAKKKVESDLCGKIKYLS